ncbi:DNA polymerase III subunit delta [Alteribacter natronophilus]|uniref:DNA polymerase III subunit delta n=1 Tax=Alteribacter natronophilus TaxID=2583810 RepID=UPI00110E934B|nr:DNA polymerase III subunit delta [Alteribacter natronophilus]TMW73877.1 DNA polymerase III subunit delta [Alteribacter natronophilus]
MSYFDIIKHLKREEPSGLYLLYGSEDFLITDTLQRIVGKVLRQEEMEFNLSRLDMKETPVEIAVEEAYTFPFMGSRRVVILKEAWFFTGSRVNWKTEHDLKKLEAYIQNPAPETVFIAVVPSEKVDERKKITKLIKKHGKVMEGKPFEERELLGWMDEKSKEYGVEIEKEAKEQLLALTASDLMMITSELNKLAVYSGEGGTITKQAVDDLVARSLEQNIFALVDGVVKGRIDVAWRIFDDLLKQKEEPIKILSLLARQFRILYQVKQLSQQGYSQKQMAGQLKLHPYAVKLAAQQAGRFDDRHLLGLLDDLADTDYRIKTGQLDKVLAVELFLSRQKKRA